MAKKDSTQSPTPTKEEENRVDVIQRKTAQLFALLTTAQGEGFESFNCHNDEIKENYLWACSDLAKQIELLARELPFNAYSIKSVAAGIGE